MATKRTIHRIESEGGDAVKRELKDVGDVGDRAFRKLRDAAKDVPPHLRAVDSAVKEARTQVDDLVGRSGVLASSLRGIGPAGIAAAAGIGALGILGKVAIDIIHSTDALNDQAAAIGINVTRLQEIRFAAGQFGVAEGEMDQGLRSFVTRLGEAHAGTGRMAERLKDMDPAFLKALLGARSSADAFDLLTKRLAQSKDASERAAIAKAALGDVGIKVAGIVAQGGQAFQKGASDAQRLGVVIRESLVKEGEEAGDELTKLAAVVKGNLATAFLTWAPLIKAAAHELAELGERARAFNERVLLGDDQKSVPFLLEKYRALKREEADLLTGFDPLGRRAAKAKEIGEELDRLQALILKRQEETEANKKLGESERDLASARTAREASEKALLKLQEEAAKGFGDRRAQIQTELGLDIVSLAGLPGEQQLPGVRAAMRKALNAVAKIEEEERKQTQQKRDQLRKESEANTERALQASLESETARLKRQLEVRVAELREQVRTGQLPEAQALKEEAAIRGQLEQALNESLDKQDKEREERWLAASKKLRELAEKESFATATAIADPLQRKLLEVDHRFEDLKQQILELQRIAGPAGRALADVVLAKLPADQAAARARVIEDDLQERNEKFLKEQAQTIGDFTDRIQAPILNAATNIQDKLTDALEAPFTGNRGRDLIEGFFEDMTATFRRALAEMAALAIAKPIIVPVVQSIGNISGQPGIGEKVAAQFGGLPGGSLFGGSEGLPGLLRSPSDTLNQLGQQLGFARYSTGSTGAPLGPGVLGPQIPADQVGFTLSQGLGLTASGIGGAFFGNQIGSFLGYGRTGATIGGGVGGVLGSVLGPAGAIGGSAIGGFYGAGVQKGLTAEKDLTKALTAASLAFLPLAPFAPFISDIVDFFSDDKPSRLSIQTSATPFPGGKPGPFGYTFSGPGTQYFDATRTNPVIDSLLKIDEVVASKLTASQRTAAAGALQAQPGQLREFFPNIPFHLVRERLDTIVSSIAGPNVVEKVTSGIQEINENIDEMVAKVLQAVDAIKAFPDAIEALSSGTLDFTSTIRATAETDIAQALTVIRGFKQQTADFGLDQNAAATATRQFVEIMIGLRDAKEPLSEAELAVKALEARFDVIGPLLAEVGINADQAAEGLRRSREALSEGFDEAIQKQILGIVDPVSLALEEFDRMAAQRVEDARTLGADLVQVERLNMLERQRILEDQNRPLKDLLTELTGTTKSVLPGEQVLTNAEAEFERIRAQVLGGDRSASDEFVEAARNLLDVSRERFASGEDFFTRQQFVVSTLQNVLGDAGGISGGLNSLKEVVPTLNNIGVEIGESNIKILAQFKNLVSEVQALRQDNAQLHRDLTRLLAS